jgi:hypothetical protein
VGVEKLLVLIFLRLKAKHGVTEEVPQFFFEEIKKIVTTFSADIFKVIETLENNHPNLGHDFHPLLATLESKFKFDSLSSPYKRKKAFQKQCGYVDPEAIFLGQNDQHFDCKYHYVSIRKSLTSLLEDKQVLEKLKEPAKPSYGNVLQDYSDGLLFQSTKRLNHDPIVLDLIIFSDAFGLTTNHKMNGFRYSIGNFSQIDNIQLISLCRDKYNKYFGWNEFSRHMVAELDSLEWDENWMARGQLGKG